jgi:hypothetical protein
MAGRETAHVRQGGSGPRLLCFYGEDAPLPDPVLTAARQALTTHYRPEPGEPFRTAGLCLYRDGRARQDRGHPRRSTGWSLTG